MNPSLGVAGRLVNRPRQGVHSFAALWQQPAWGRRMTVVGQVMLVAGLIAVAVIVGLNHRAEQLRTADTFSTDSLGIQPSSVVPRASQDTGSAAGGKVLTSPHRPAFTTRAVARILQLPAAIPNLPRQDIGSLALPEMAVTVTWGSDASVTRTVPGTAGQGGRTRAGPRPMTALPAAVTVLAIAAAVSWRRRRAASSQDRDATLAEPAIVEAEQDDPVAEANKIDDDEERLPSSPADVPEVPDPDIAAVGDHSPDSADFGVPIAFQDAPGPLPGGTRDAEEVHGADPERLPLQGAPPPDPAAREPADTTDSIASSDARYSLTFDPASNQTLPAVDRSTRVLLFSAPHPEVARNADLTDSNPLPAQPSVATGSIIRRPRTARVR